VCCFEGRTSHWSSLWWEESLHICVVDLFISLHGTLYFLLYSWLYNSHDWVNWV
jgi:hypothetical protein